MTISCFSLDVCFGWEVSHRPERYCVGLKHREDVQQQSSSVVKAEDLKQEDP
jgi:hypothetical protein